MYRTWILKNTIILSGNKKYSDQPLPQRTITLKKLSTWLMQWKFKTNIIQLMCCKTHRSDSIILNWWQNIADQPAPIWRNASQTHRIHKRAKYPCFGDRGVAYIEIYFVKPNQNLSIRYDQTLWIQRHLDLKCCWQHKRTAIYPSLHNRKHNL